ncbi:MAG: patatin-like phospholipase family protein [Candidatus Omnitrophica bacterium]|nr:patatin-like phospholipase family protein [Candidatus Omnitrophota bacterium]
MIKPYIQTLALLAIALLLGAMSRAPKAISPPPRPAKVAVVLGAGASRGFAHVGVLKILEAHKIPIHMVVGTSVGSLVGCLYAYGYDGYQLQTLALALERDDLVDLTLPDNGFIKGEKLENYVNRMVQGAPIETFRIPFHAVAADIQTGNETVFGTGNAGMAVRASCSIPGVFQPARISGNTYVDGGLVSPVAVDVARRYGADVVLAVDISARRNMMTPQGMIDTILQSVDIMHAKISQLQLPGADVVIKPQVGHIGSSDFTKRSDAILEGEKAAAAAMPAIEAVLIKFRQDGRIP